MTDTPIRGQLLDPERMIILSLRPHHAEAILSGLKTVELRRIEPKIIVPTRALIYATTPIKALLGTCIVDTVITDGLAELWKAYGSRTGIRHAEFRDYFKGLKVGSALALSDARQFSRQIPLAELRASDCVDRPPQSYSYVNAAIGNQLLQLAA